MSGSRFQHRTGWRLYRSNSAAISSSTGRNLLLSRHPNEAAGTGVYRLRMRPGIAVRCASCLLAAVSLVACAITAPDVSGSPRPTLPPSTQRQVTLADAKRCPRTQPTSDPSPGGPALFGSSNAYGNAQLWVGALGPDGVIEAPADMVNKDGSIGWKFGWWRVASGELTISGRRVDGPAPPARGDVPSGYGPSGFQASGVTFPTEGCWEITGHVGSATLTFVIFVIKRLGGVSASASCDARIWPKTVVSCTEAQRSISRGASGSGGNPLIWLTTLEGVDTAFGPGRQVTNHPTDPATPVWVFVYGANPGPDRFLHVADATNPRTRDGAFIYAYTWAELGSAVLPTTLPAPILP